MRHRSGGAEASESRTATRLPSGLKHVRTTALFDQDSVPKALLAAHQVAENVWGRLVVATGQLRFTFEDAPDADVVVAGGESVVIPPRRPHRLTLLDDVEFVVEFYRAK